MQRVQGVGKWQRMRLLFLSDCKHLQKSHHLSGMVVSNAKKENITSSCNYFQLKWQNARKSTSQVFAPSARCSPPSVLFKFTKCMYTCSFHCVLNLVGYAVMYLCVYICIGILITCFHNNLTIFEQFFLLPTCGCMYE